MAEIKKEKKQKVEEEKETEIDKQIKKQIKQYFPFFIWLVVLALVFIIFYFLFQGLGKIEYEGITFKKVMYGNIPLYSYIYNLITPTGEIFNYNLLLRNNPAKNKVFVEPEKIEIIREKIVYVTINGSGFEQCNDTIIAVAQISQYLSGNLYAVKGATPDFENAKLKNMTYANCDTYPENTIIKLEAGNETIIYKKDNCYIIRAANCEILPAAEKFIVESLVDAKNAGYVTF